MDRIRRLESSESKIIPSTLSYSSCRGGELGGRRGSERAYQLDIGAHLLYLLHLDHDELIRLGESVERMRSTSSRKVVRATHLAA
jgi:hypothetical protein